MKRFFNIENIINNFPDGQKRILRTILYIVQNDDKNNIAFFVDRKYKQFKLLNILVINDVTGIKKYLVTDNRKNCIKLSKNRYNWIDLEDIEDFRKYLYK